MNYWIYLGIIAILSIGVVVGAYRRHPASPILSIIAIVMVRAVPNLPPTMHWRPDSYHYFSLTAGILQTGHLSLPREMMQVTFEERIVHGVYNVLTAELGILIDVTGPSLRLYTPIILGILGYVAAVLLLRGLVETRLALIGGYLFAMLPTVVVFSYQYHQFGFAEMVAAFAIAVVFGIEIDLRRRMLIVLPVMVAISLSHIFFPSMFAGLLLFGWAAYIVLRDYWTPRNWTTVDLYDRPTAIMTVLVIFAAAIIYTQENLILLGATEISSAINGGGNLNIQTSATASGAGTSVFDSVPLYTKITLGIVSIPTAVALLWRKASTTESLMVAFLGILSVFAVVAILTPRGPSSRVLSFMYLFLVSTAFISIHHYAPMDRIPIGRITLAGILVVSIIVASAPTRPAPSLVDETIDISGDGFHQVTPITQEGPKAGYWLRSYYPPNRLFYTGEHEATIAFYYGLVKVRRFDKWDSPAVDGILVDTYRYGEYHPKNRVYDGGRLVIHRGDSLPFPTAQTAKTRPAR